MQSSRSADRRRTASAEPSGRVKMPGFCRALTKLVNLSLKGDKSLKTDNSHLENGPKLEKF